MARLEFASDYMEGCIPEILTRLTETNLEKSGSSRKSVERSLDF